VVKADNGKKPAVAKKIAKAAAKAA